jgi:hypothetical protein
MRVIRAVAGLLAVGTISTGLGASASAATLTAKQLVAKAVTATEAVTSVHFVGVVLQDTQEVSLNVSATSTGVGQGTIGIGKGTAVVRSVHGIDYFKGNAKFWTEESGKSAAELFAGRWVSASAKSSGGLDLNQFLNSTALTQNLFGSGFTQSTLALDGTAKIGGHRVTVVKGADENGKGSGKIFITKSSPPYIMKVSFSSTSGSGSILLSNFNKPVRPVAPKNAINLGSLGGSGSG